MIIVCGTSFAGKSTLAQLLTERFGYPEAAVDETKARLFGPAVDDRTLTPADWTTIYHETNRLIEHHLRSGRSIIDASRNFTKAERQQAKLLCLNHHAGLLTIHVDTPEHITRQRLLANRQTRIGRRRDVTDDDFNAILAAWEPPIPDEHPLLLRFDQDPAPWIDQHAAILSHAGSA